MRHEYFGFVFTTGQVSFSFNWGRTVKKWVKNTNSIVESGLLDETIDLTGMASCFCSRCGASLSGKSATVKFPYCDSYVSID